MAKMIDSKPERSGEAKAWESFSNFLTSDDVVYTNRAINGREFDECIMSEGKGLIVVEVKGWTSSYILNVKNEDTILLAGQVKPAKSPRKQAMSYRYALLGLLNEKLGINPLVMNMVCYPFITKKEYYDKGLNIISDENMTIFAEELDDGELLRKKLMSRYIQDQVICHDELTHRMFTSIRHYFEPNYDFQREIKLLNPGYSRLRIYRNTLSENEINEIISEYFKGIKEYVFVLDNNSLVKLNTCLSKELRNRSLWANRNSISISIDENHLLTNSESSLCIFNFECYVCQELRNITNNNLIIEEGRTDQYQQAILNKLSEITNFNYQQYLIEHANANQNILVTAGAGTGKTYSMVSRIAYLCNRIDSPIVDIANDIVMITFTNDAADNMKKRLKQLFMNYFVLTSDQKYVRLIDNLSQIQISTIHKFSIEILRKTCMQFGLGSDFEISNETYNKNRFYHIRLNNYLERKNEEDDTFDQKQKLSAYQIQNLLIDFSDHLYGKSIDVKSLNEEMLGHCEGLSYFNELIENVVIPAEKDYSEFLRTHNYVDLRQCMIMVNQVVNSNQLNNHGLAYKYMFVDEFQDTDDIQIDTLLHLQKLFGQQCKLFIVGDLKQSIYRFRGATLSAFDKVKKNGSWNEFSLNRNYRTDARLLLKYENTFEKMSSYGLLPYSAAADRLSSRVYKQYSDSNLINVIEINFKQPAEAYNQLFSELKKQREQLLELSKREQLSSAEKTIAILTRYNYEINNIVKASKGTDINVEITEGGDLYRLQSTLDTYKLVLALTNPTEPVYLSNFIESNYINLKTSLLYLHNLNNQEKVSELVNILNQYFMDRIEKSWNQTVMDFQTRPVLVVLREIYESFQPWNQYSKDPEKQRFYRENYECLLEKITQKYRRDFLTLNMISDFLEINITTWQEQASRKHNNDQGVRIVCTTVHKSKGLEYGTVVLPFTSEDFSSEKNTGTTVNLIENKLAYKIAADDNVIISNDYYESSDEAIEHSKEECRILYVAMTRAIRNFVWFKNNDRNCDSSWGGMLEVSQ